MGEAESDQHTVWERERAVSENWRGVERQERKPQDNEFCEWGSEEVTPEDKRALYDMGMPMQHVIEKKRGEGGRGDQHTVREGSKWEGVESPPSPSPSSTCSALWEWVYWEMRGDGQGGWHSPPYTYSLTTLPCLSKGEGRKGDCKVVPDGGVASWTREHRR